MGLFSRKGHRRLDSADQDNEVAAHESSGMQAIVVNVTVPTTSSFGAEFSADNHIISIAKDSICSKTQLKEGDLIVQVNGAGTETKSVAEMIKGEEQLSITILRKRGTDRMHDRKSNSSSSVDKDEYGMQDEVKPRQGISDEDR